MKLLNVQVVLDADRGIRRAEYETEVFTELDDKTTSYAIVSHRWGTEVSYKEMVRLMKRAKKEKERVRQRDGYKKIVKSCKQAMKDGYKWLWIDTCCIDKRSSAELSEAINSMYRWYRNSQKCYVYLNDVDEPAFPTEQDFSRFGRSNGWPEWFSRGWTLQELIAPTQLEFFNTNWVSIGTKEDLTSTLEEITRIPKNVLRDKEAFMRTEFWERPPVAHIMSWAAGRKTTRVEDRAYSLLGLFGVNMPMLYGEGSKAFQRLQLEIIRVSGDHSIFAWNPKGQFGAHQGVLADDPSYFRGCHDITRVDANFFGEVETYMRHNGPVSVDEDKLGSLERGAYSRQFSVFNVTNVGIQVWLPILPCGGISGYFTVILPCLDRYGNLITINLESRGLGLSSGKCLGLANIRDVCPEFRSLYLAYAQDAEQKCHKISLDDRRTSWHGFTRCGTFPWEVTGDTVTLSSRGNTFIVLVYANNDVRCRFAVGLGYYLGRPWANIVCDEYPANQEFWSSSGAHFAQQVYDILWNAPIEKSYLRSTMKGVHLPRSIWDARIIVSSATDVMIDIEQCPGCCTGPRECTPLADHPWVPWTSQSYGSHELELGGQSARLHECISQGVALGDYGDYSSNDNFKRRGNIFEDLVIDPTDSIYRPIVSRVSSSKRVRRHSETQHDVVVVSHSWGVNLALYQPKALSLPNDQKFELLLKTWATRFAGNCLVTTVIECSEFYRDDREGRRVDVEDPASRCGDQSADPRTFIPLCIIEKPLAWRKEPACALRRQQFKHIREHFYALANLHHLAGVQAHHNSAKTKVVDFSATLGLGCLKNFVSQARHKSADTQQKANGIVDFPATFGLDHLKNFVGEITFFERLRSIIEVQLCANNLPAHLFNPSSQNPVVVAPLLFGKWSSGEKRKTRRVVQSISQTLSVGLLDHICTSFLDTSKGKQRTDQVGHTDHDVVNVLSTVREIEVLQEKLQATEDEDEHRALEEDITGKILWFYWRGIRSEVDQILAKVKNFTREGTSTRMISDVPTHRDLGDIAEIIKESRRMELDDDMAHLQRIMLDAGAGISRHQLWLASRPAGLAGLSGLPGGNPILCAQENVSSISPEAPSTSTALDANKRRFRLSLRRFNL